jgi:HSP20 family protein
MFGLRGNGLAVGQFQNEMDRVFKSFFGEPAVAGRRSLPLLNVWETEDALHLEAELPGFKMEELDLQVVGNELAIKGERKRVEETDKLVFHRQERVAGRFERTLRLPMEIDAAKVEASLQDGVLSVTLPKAAAAKPRKIQVRQGK